MKKKILDSTKGGWLLAGEIHAAPYWNTYWRLRWPISQTLRGMDTVDMELVP